MLKHLMSSEEWSEKNVTQKGFTLIELLIVIAILGILAVIGILSFSGLRGRANTAKNTTELKEVQTAAQAFQAADPSGAMPTGVGVLVTGDYLDATPTCNYTDFTGKPRDITFQGTC